ncbi:hypothetical protein [Chamaesiphon polymorphus]|uniref:hypothetical protein n=1 Tax=Chamaesiphon polymorphus TaxID=2107691 RepID=UPI0015E6DDFB|nr:hypothetical protein [Chamaesiphon polymorphus]
MGRSGASTILDRLAKQRTRSAFLVTGEAINALVRSISHRDRLTETVVPSKPNISYMA